RFRSGPSSGLIVENRALNTCWSYLDSSAPNLELRFKGFDEGLRASGGNFYLAVVPVPLMTPVAVIKCPGGIDLTGLSEQALDARDAGKIPAAISLFEKAREKAPYLHGIDAEIGHCHRLISRSANSQAVKRDQFELAKNAYKNELASHPDSSDALAGLGFLAAQAGNNEEARGYFRESLDRQPYRLSVMQNLIKLTVMDCLNRGKEGENTVMETVRRYLLPQYFMCPQHPAHLELFTALIKEHKLDISALILQSRASLIHQ
ncbi:MAG: tetratricopeptide repeat protein, partial [Candidatus Riflebacteria bacterium]